MENNNRLINDFKKQTKTTIWKHLDAMASNYAVYSTHLNGFTPFLSNYDVYLYCNANNVVMLCLDNCEHGEEQMYAETESLSSLIFEKDCEPHVSAVWRLAKAVKLAEERLQKRNSDIQVYGVLLTEAEILNSYMLYDLWDEHHVMVIDEFTRLKHRHIPLNEDTEVDGSDYVATILDILPVHQDKDDEFDKLVDMFINGGMEVVDEEEPDNNDDEDNDVEDILIPDGNIEQNQNISVKVEILRPIANPKEELDKLVGCADIKQRMEELIDLTCYNQR